MTTKTGTFTTGDLITANDLNALAGPWNSYTPTLKQGATTVSKTVTRARYCQFGKLVWGVVRLVVTGTGSSGSPITVSLPVTAAASGTPVGTATINDYGANAYSPIAHLDSTTTVAFRRTDTLHSLYFGAEPAMALAANDEISFEFHYEAA